jgi:hypothetical protein
MSHNDDLRDHLARWLDNGWKVVGYNTALLAMGNVTHFVLIQNGCELKSVCIVFDRQRVLGTSVFDLSPGEQQQ